MEQNATERHAAACARGWVRNGADGESAPRWCGALTEAEPKRSLGARTVVGAGWLMGWRFASRALGIVNTVVLVRLLVPADFGLVALATSFSFAIDSLSYMGVQEALVREHSLDRSLYDTAFTLNLVRGAFTALIIVACAWPAARFFGDMRLTTIFLILALCVFLSAMDNIGTVDFQRDLAFGKQVQIMFVPRIAGIIASITFAELTHSYWALVVSVLVNRGMRLIFTYVVHPYRPRITVRAWRRLVGFSFWSWALSMTALLQGRAETMVIGGYLNPTAVGIYSVGGEIGGLASSELLEPMSQALFAGFSSARRSGDSVATAYLRAISVVVLLTLPANAGIAMIARPMTHLVFGAHWDDAVPLIQLFAFVGMFRIAGSISGALLMAEGVPQIGFRVEAVMTVLRLTILLTLVPTFGLIGAASGMAAAGLLEEVIYLVITFRRFGLTAGNLAANIWRPMLSTAAMGAVLWACGLTQVPTTDSALVTGLLLALAVAAGALVYGVTLLLAWVGSGRPRGSETYFLGMAGQALRSRLRRYRPARPACRYAAAVPALAQVLQIAVSTMSGVMARRHLWSYGQGVDSQQGAQGTGTSRPIRLGSAE
jgi:O-antigen/teichoic acid export membrane protein